MSIVIPPGGRANSRGLSNIAIGWRDNVQSFLTAKLAGSKQPTFSTINGGIGAYQFSHLQEQELHLAFHIDHDYAEGTAIFPHVHWCPTTADTGVVRWGFEYTAAKGHNQETFSAAQTVYMEQAGPGIVDQHMIAEVADPGILITGLETDSILLCRVFRDAAHANDTFGASVFGFMADIHYQCTHYATINKAPNFFV